MTQLTQHELSHRFCLSVFSIFNRQVPEFRSLIDRVIETGPMNPQSQTARNRINEVKETDQVFTTGATALEMRQGARFRVRVSDAYHSVDRRGPVNPPQRLPRS